MTIDDAKSSLSLPEVFTKLSESSERSSIVIISGSEKDAAHVSKIQKSLLKYDQSFGDYICKKDVYKLKKFLPRLRVGKIY